MCDLLREINSRERERERGGQLRHGAATSESRRGAFSRRRALAGSAGGAHGFNSVTSARNEPSARDELGVRVLVDPWSGW